MNLFRLKSGNSTNHKFGERALLLVALVLICFGLSPTAQAVVPAPDGGYPNNNTAEGDSALLSLTTGASNTAIGFAALASDLVGSDNTAVGTAALIHNTASNNTATGSLALFTNTNGTRNTATGFAALFSNNAGSDNTAVGWGALAFNASSDGVNNTAVGSQALLNNVEGFDNTAVGFQALRNTTTSNNTAVGSRALASNTGGDGNIAVGSLALFNSVSGFSNVAVGSGALQLSETGFSNIALGNGAGFLIEGGSGNIDIGNIGSATDGTEPFSGVIRIGTNTVQTTTFIAGISGVNQGSPTAVFINTTTGQLGTTPPASSRRFKKEIKAMDKISEAILAFKPVTFHYRSDIQGTPQFGLIAEEVAAVNPDLVMRDEKGEIYTVRYEAVNAMLLNEFLKEHRKNEKQEKTIAELKSGMTALAATVKEQASQIQKVSAQLEASKPAPQVVNNP
jgi:hypothetical protein